MSRTSLAGAPSPSVAGASGKEAVAPCQTEEAKHYWSFSCIVVAEHSQERFSLCRCLSVGRLPATAMERWRWSGAGPPQFKGIQLNTHYFEQKFLYIYMYMLCIHCKMINNSKIQRFSVLWPKHVSLSAPTSQPNGQMTQAAQ